MRRRDSTYLGFVGLELIQFGESAKQKNVKLQIQNEVQAREGACASDHL